MPVRDLLSGGAHVSTQVRFPIDPLYQQVRLSRWDASDEDVAESLGVTRRTILRWINVGLSELAADRAAAAFKALAETYARDPAFYGATFCVSCSKHRPVGPDGEFVWDDGTKVGT